jgi:malate/lactate dehydrogenase
LVAAATSQVSAHVGDAELESCLKGCELVVIPAGVPRKPGMTRDDLFNINAGIVMNLVTACAKYCPNVSGLVGGVRVTEAEAAGMEGAPQAAMQELR